MLFVLLHCEQMYTACLYNKVALVLYGDRQGNDHKFHKAWDGFRISAYSDASSVTLGADFDEIEL